MNLIGKNYSGTGGIRSMDDVFHERVNGSWSISNLFSDNFDGTNGQLISARTSTSGHTYTRIYDFGTDADTNEIQSNNLVQRVGYHTSRSYYQPNTEFPKGHKLTVDFANIFRSGPYREISVGVHYGNAAGIYFKAGYYPSSFFRVDITGVGNPLYTTSINTSSTAIVIEHTKSGIYIAGLKAAGVFTKLATYDPIIEGLGEYDPSKSFIFSAYQSEANATLSTITNVIVEKV
jgi:hypothetical protein